MELDPTFAPAWVGLGQAYAAADELEAAMTAYRAAMRLWPGAHVPPLAMAALSLRAGNVRVLLC